MATIGTELTEFTLNGRRIKREAGSLRLEDGTLAGADLDMISAVRFIHGLGLPLEEALRMASLYPAAALGVASRYGHLGAGARADFVCLGEGLSVDAVWIGGSRAF
jgi:N-acetylglucosamine-6-phosphate deacetylase